MSIQMVGAVISCGPQDRTEFCVMISLANYADEFGFCFPSIETIAADSRCDARTARRAVDELVRKGWVYCARKVVNGKSNAYILNIGRMGVTAPSESRRSPMFMRLCKVYGDRMSPIFAPEKTEDTREFSEDNPQPPQGTTEESQGTNSPTQRTFEGGSEDIACPPNRYNRQGAVKDGTVKGTVNDVEPVPPTPSGEGAETDRLRSRGDGEDAQVVEKLCKSVAGAKAPGETGRLSVRELDQWARFKLALKGDLASVSQNLARTKGWTTVVAGVQDYDGCFRDWWLEEVQGSNGGVTLFTSAANAAPTLQGITKYRDRLKRLAATHFRIAAGTEVTFAVVLTDGTHPNGKETRT